MLNVDYKLVTKALSQRLREILPRIIHTDQAGFVQNRFLGSNVLDVQTLLHYFDQAALEHEVAFLSLDIYKAFDSVNWQFLNNLLNSYGFPAYFTRWIQTMQAQVEIRVANNGHLSSPIEIQKGLAQGCCLSPFLFLLVIETLAHHIRSNPRIEGVQFLHYHKKINLVADDCLLTLKASVENLQNLTTVLEHFSLQSGLHINCEKSVLMHEVSDNAFCTHPAITQFKNASFGEGVSYLGTRLGKKSVLNSNFQVTKSLVTDVLKNRPTQLCSVSGKILQVKSLVASKFVYKFMLLPTPPAPLLRMLDSIYHNHIWNEGRHKMSKQKAQLPKREGGLNMINVFHQNASLKLGWLNRFLSDTSSMTFTQYFMFECTVIPFNEFLKCNLTPRNSKFLLKRKPPKFIECIFQFWFERTHISDKPTPNQRDEMLNSLFCFNDVTLIQLSFTEQHTLYQFLADNNVYTLREVLSNVTDILAAMALQAPTLCNPLQ